jgi:hypothetical protein
MPAQHTPANPADVRVSHAVGIGKTSTARRVLALDAHAVAVLLGCYYVRQSVRVASHL